MPVTFYSSYDLDDSFLQALSALGDAITAETTLEALPDLMLFETPEYTFRIEGEDFTYMTVSGRTILTGGTIINAVVFSDDGLVGSFTNMTLSATDYATAIAEEYLGANPIALERLFFQNSFVFQGTDTKDVLLQGSVTDDGFSIEPGRNDIAYLRGGNDRFAMGRGDDIAYGGKGWDKLRGGQGDDTLYGESGSDRLWGNDGKDVLVGATGNDTLFGGNSRDSLAGGSGNDSLYGGRNRDTLDGGKGDDMLAGGAGDDILTGGTGADSFVFQRGRIEGDDIITDFETGVDTIYIEIARGYNIEDVVSGALITINGLSTVLLEGVYEADLDLMTDIQFG